MGHFCIQYPNEMSEQSLPYAQLKLMQQIHYKHSTDVKALTKTLCEGILQSRESVIRRNRQGSEEKDNAQL